MMRMLLCGLALLLATSAAHAAPQTISLPCEAKGVRISRDASTAALLCPDGSGPILALPSGKVLRTINMDHPAMDALLAPDGAWLVLLWRDGRIAAYPVHGSDAPKTWSVGVMPSTYFFLPNGLLLMDRTLWNIPNARAEHAFETDFDFINSASTNDERIATAGADTTIRGYDKAGWKQLFVNREMLMEPFGIAFTADGTRLVVGGADFRVNILDPATGRTIKAFPPLKDYINDIVPLAAKDWVAMQFADARTADPTYWRLLNVASGEMRNICGTDKLVRFIPPEALCFTLGKNALESSREPLP